MGFGSGSRGVRDSQDPWFKPWRLKESRSYTFMSWKVNNVENTPYPENKSIKAQLWRWIIRKIVKCRKRMNSSINRKYVLSQFRIRVSSRIQTFGSQLFPDFSKAMIRIRVFEETDRFPERSEHPDPKSL